MTNENNPFGDVTKMMEQFKLPGVDMTAIVEARRKDIEALMEANKAAFETLQALGRKQSEMATAAMQSVQDVAKSGAALGDPAKQTELVKKTFDKALADMQELAEMTRHAQADALAHITQRSTERLQEIKSLMTPK